MSKYKPKFILSDTYKANPGSGWHPPGYWVAELPVVEMIKLPETSKALPETRAQNP